MVFDSSVEARKVDKKAALAIWDTAVIPNAKKKKDEEADVLRSNGPSILGTDNVMNFTLLSRRGHKQQVSHFAGAHRSYCLTFFPLIDSATCYP